MIYKDPKKKGFTLIEVIVVIAVMGLVLPALFSIIFSILKQQVEIYQVTEVKRQGDSALSTMETAIRPIVKISTDSAGTNPKCADTNRYPADPIYSDGAGAYPFFFTDKDNNVFQIYLTNGVLRYVVNGTPNLLTTSKVKITSFQLACQRKTTYSPTTVMIIFTVQYNTTLIPNPPLTYRARVVLRNE